MPLADAADVADVADVADATDATGVTSHQLAVSASRRALNVAMVAYSAYERDNRVMRVARALADRGDRVQVLALRGEAGLPKQEVIDGVHVHRIQDRFHKEEGGALAALAPLLRFTVAAARHLVATQARSQAGPLDLVHVHNVPDFLVFAAWPARLRGARLILDLHDLVPEFYASRFGSGSASLLVAALRLCERASAAFADHVIVSNHLWCRKVAARSAAPDKCSVMVNHVDEQVFRMRPRRRAFAEGGPLIVFPGGLQAHQGLDMALRAFARLRRERPDARFHLHGDGPQRPALQALARELGLDGAVRFFDPRPLQAIADVMADADLGVVPKLASGFGNEAYSTKIMEFMALGVPLVVSRTRIDQHYFDDSMVRFFDSGDEASMARAMREVLQDGALRERLVEGGLAHASAQRWGRHRPRYLELVDGLVSRRPAAAPRWVGAGR